MWRLPWCWWIAPFLYLLSMIKANVIYNLQYRVLAILTRRVRWLSNASSRGLLSTSTAVLNIVYCTRLRYLYCCTVHGARSTLATKATETGHDYVEHHNLDLRLVRQYTASDISSFSNRDFQGRQYRHDKISLIHSMLLIATTSLHFWCRRMDLEKLQKSPGDGKPRTQDKIEP